MDVFDNGCAPEYFISGMEEPENIGGGCFRITFYVNQHIGEQSERLAVVKLICPIEAVRDGALKAAKAIGMTMSGRDAILAAMN